MAAVDVVGRDLEPLVGLRRRRVVGTLAHDLQSLTGAYSPYEQHAISEAETELDIRVDPSPEGKTVESIELMRLDPIDDHNPLPVAIDVLHTTTRPWVLDRRARRSARSSACRASARTT